MTITILVYKFIIEEKRTYFTSIFPFGELVGLGFMPNDIIIWWKKHFTFFFVFGKNILPCKGVKKLCFLSHRGSGNGLTGI